MSDETSMGMFDTERIGANISRLRKNAGFTQSSLADALNVSYQAVSNWERGKSAPDIAKLFELSALLNASIDAILGNTRFTEIVNSLGGKGEIDNVTVDEIKEISPILTPDNADRLIDQVKITKDNIPHLTDIMPSLSEKKVDEIAQIVAVVMNAEDGDEDCFREPENTKEPDAEKGNDNNKAGYGADGINDSDMGDIGVIPPVPEIPMPIDSDTDSDSINGSEIDSLKDRTRSLWEKINSQISEIEEEIKSAENSDSDDIEDEDEDIDDDEDIDEDDDIDDDEEDDDDDDDEEDSDSETLGDISEAFEDMEEDFSEAMDDVKEAIGDVKGDISDALSDLSDAMKSLGDMLGINGVGESIKGTIPEVTGAIKGAFDKLGENLSELGKSIEKKKSNPNDILSDFMPFMSKEKADSVARENIKTSDSKSRVRSLPFMSRDEVDELAENEFDENGNLTPYFPFMSRAKVDDILVRSAENGSIRMETLKKALPFASRDAVDRAGTNLLKNYPSELPSCLPFMSRDRIDAILIHAADNDTLDMRTLERAMPFASREAIDATAVKLLRENPDEISKVLPFMSKDKIDEILIYVSQDGNLNESIIKKVLPFASREVIDDIVTDSIEKSGYQGIEILTSSLPFMSRDKIDEIIVNSVKSGSMTKAILKKCLPFASRDAVDFAALNVLSAGDDISPFLPFMSKSAVDKISMGDNTDAFLSSLPFMSRENVDRNIISLVENGRINEGILNKCLPFASRNVIDTAAEFVVENYKTSINSFLPFMSREKIGEIMKKQTEKMVNEDCESDMIVSLLPFADRGCIDWCAFTLIEGEKYESGVFEKLLPFMSKEAIDRSADMISDVEKITPMAPFVSKKMMTELIMRHYNSGKELYALANVIIFSDVANEIIEKELMNESVRPFDEMKFIIVCADRNHATDMLEKGIKAGIYTMDDVLSITGKKITLTNYNGSAMTFTFDRDVFDVERINGLFDELKD